MSNLIYPKLNGEQWPSVKRPMFSTIINTVASGGEIRIPNYGYPRWQWELSYSRLGAADEEQGFQRLLGFFCSRGGAFDSFLFDDDNSTVLGATPSASSTDNYVVGQHIGTGDGATQDFQMQRTLGGATQPIFAVNGVTANYPELAPPPINVYLDSVVQSVGYSISASGLLSFGSAPNNGVVITADFGYFWRVRFEEGVDFENFLYQLWRLKKVTLQSVRA